MYQRFMQTKIETALTDTPVIYIAGPRQSGKSTLAKMIGDKNHRPYFSLDDINILSIAKNDPVGFVEGLPEQCTLDEVQRAPEIMLPLKLSVDNNRKAGRFLLTGSANILALPAVSDSLAGRMEIYELSPLSYAERYSTPCSWLNNLFDVALKELFATKSPNKSYEEIYTFIHSGGYPDVQDRVSSSRHTTWFSSYIQTIIERDVTDILRIEDIFRIKTLLSHLSLRSGTLVNTSDLSRLVGIPNSTTVLYQGVLETLFLISKTPAWFSNKGKRLLKTPKLFMKDTGLLCHLLGLQTLSAMMRSPEWGRILETFVYTELNKQISFQDQNLSLNHYRTVTGTEVDFILEKGPNQIFGIEVKATKTLGHKDFKGLQKLQEDYPDIVKGGIILYQGEMPLFLSNNIAAIPMTMVV